VGTKMSEQTDIKNRKINVPTFLPPLDGLESSVPLSRLTNKNNSR